VVRHLRPLGIAANIIQAAFCRLDSVATTFGYLIWAYGNMTDEDDIPGRDAIIKSIEKRWQKTDQEVFVAAVILNPFYRLAPFGTRLNNADVALIIVRLWQRFNKSRDVPSPEFLSQLQDYLTLKNMFSGLSLMCQIETARAERENETPDPLRVYDGYKFGDQDPIFVAFARHILSISANSASCERLFSSYGSILTKYRTRLLLKNLTNTAEL
ncbi:hypothetical protein HYPSUDRAFT_120776, partial [Hypholoma sublateritium FD-334 SS-4]